MATANNKGDAARRATKKAIRVVAKREGFRRAGFSFGAEPMSIALADISEEQEAQLRAESMLVVVDTEIAEPAKAEGDKAQSDKIEGDKK